MPLKFFVIARLTFLNKARMQLFADFSIVLFIYNVAWSKKYVIKFHCLPNFMSYFVGLCSFTFSFFSTVPSFSVIKIKSDVELAVDIFDWLSVISEVFQSRFWKSYFHFWSLSSWLAGFSFVLVMLFLPLPSFTVCHTKRDGVSSSKFVILFICFLIYILFVLMF